jgi:hypothetical protein
MRPRLPAIAHTIKPAVFTTARCRSNVYSSAGTVRYVELPMWTSLAIAVAAIGLAIAVIGLFVFAILLALRGAG